MSHWIYLFVGILFEIAGTFCLKLSEGFSHLIPSLLSIILFIIALAFVTLALKTIDVSVGYAIWSGVGIAGITMLGFFYFQEPISLMRLFFIILIIIGVIGLQVFK